MNRHFLFYPCIFISGMLVSNHYSKTISDDSNYRIQLKGNSYYLESKNFSKIITDSGELGSVYERMQGLLKEDKIDLEYSLKRIQRSRLANSTPSMD